MSSMPGGSGARVAAAARSSGASSPLPASSSSSSSSPVVRMVRRAGFVRYPRGAGSSSSFIMPAAHNQTSPHDDGPG